MSIKVGIKMVESDAEGYVLNQAERDEQANEAVALQQSQQDGVKLTETHWGLIH